MQQRVRVGMHGFASGQTRLVPRTRAQRDVVRSVCLFGVQHPSVKGGVRVHHLRAHHVDPSRVGLFELVQARLLPEDLKVLRLLGLPLADDVEDAVRASVGKIVGRDKLWELGHRVPVQGVRSVVSHLRVRGSLGFGELPVFFVLMSQLGV